MTPYKQLLEIISFSIERGKDYDCISILCDDCLFYSDDGCIVIHYEEMKDAGEKVLSNFIELSDRDKEKQ